MTFWINWKFKMTSSDISCIYVSSKMCQCSIPSLSTIPIEKGDNNNFQYLKAGTCETTQRIQMNMIYSQSKIF